MYHGLALRYTALVPFHQEDQDAPQTTRIRLTSHGPASTSYVVVPL